MTENEKKIVEFISRVNAFSGHKVVHTNWGADGPRTIADASFVADLERSMVANNIPVERAQAVAEFVRHNKRAHEYIINNCGQPMLYPVFSCFGQINQYGIGRLVASIALSTATHQCRSGSSDPVTETELTIGHEEFHYFLTFQKWQKKERNAAEEPACDVGSIILQHMFGHVSDKKKALEKRARWREQHKGPYAYCAPVLRALHENYNWMTGIPWRDTEQVAVAAAAFATTVIAALEERRQLTPDELRAAVDTAINPPPEPQRQTQTKTRIVAQQRL
ncbi:MAG: hypothetical protein AB7G06_05560 [Bdellovibrionales bacterium]